MRLSVYGSIVLLGTVMGVQCRYFKMHYQLMLIKNQLSQMISTISQIDIHIEVIIAMHH